MSDLLLERETELAAINRAIRVARAGCGRQLVISGPPGCGRSALLERACAIAAEQGLDVLAAAGEPRERDFPFALARRLLDGDAAAPEDRYARFVELNSRLAARAPALVAIDDLDWGDVDTLEWLAFAVRRLRRTPIAVIATAHRVVLPDAVVVRPRPLSERAVAALLHVELGRVIDARLAAAWHRATGGQPRLVCELAVAARRDCVPETEDGEAWLATAVPPAIADLIERRLAALTPECRAFARAVAVHGGAPHEVAALAGLGPDAAASASDCLQDAGLLAGGAITPPILARALYASIPPARRAGMHANAARYGAAAYHLLRSEPMADHWVVATLRRVAAQALEGGRPEEAAELLRRATREGIEGGRAELLIELAHAERRLADGGEIRRLEVAVEHGVPQEAVAGALARALLTHGRADDALALAGADAAEVHAGARLHPGAGATAAARLAAAVGDTPALLACRAAEAVCAGTSAETAISLATRALDDDGLDPESPAFFLACAALAWSDRLELALRGLERALAHARRLGSVAGLVRAEVGLAGVSLRAGDVEAALVHATTALGSGRGTALAVPARAVLVLALLELDRPDDAAAACDASTPELRYARGRLRLVRCDTRGALDDLLAVGRALIHDAIEAPAVIPWRSAAALAFPPDAATLAGEEHALAVRFGAPTAIGRALRALAAIGPATERTQRCREAVSALEPGEARLEYAHALCDLGASLRHDRLRRDAREPLREALDLAVRCGAAALARRAREELAATGARPRRLAQSGRDALTPAELRVARLAARGLANREIAQTLVVTVKTVETELGHAYAKLGIRSRRDLAAALQTAG